MELIKDRGDRSLSFWARDLWKRVKALVQGKPDPFWRTEYIEQIYGPGWKPRDVKFRLKRLQEVLKTIDGIFMQKYMAYTDKVWSWKAFDLHTLGNLSYLIGDEFFDGDLSVEALKLTSNYTLLKKYRKQFKQAQLRGAPAMRAFVEEKENPLNGFPFFLRQFLPYWERASGEVGYKGIYRQSILTQTRGAGTPPTLVVHQSKFKFLQTVTGESPPLSQENRRLIISALASIKIPKEAVGGIASKARIQILSTACFEATRQVGGKAEFLRGLLTTASPNSQVTIWDLEVGKPLGSIEKRYITDGDYIFWLCWNIIIKTHPDELSKSFVCVVKEPGKGRTVTKAVFCLTVILDVINKICSSVLSKTFSSSASGMLLADHGWNFSESLYEEDIREDIFDVLYKEAVDDDDGARMTTEYYRDYWISSTDYSEATDNMSHRVGMLIGDFWMHQCGIPKALRGLVQRCCYNPRNILFTARGPFAGIGQPVVGDAHIRYVKMTRGVLMGDPLTKVVLHLLNIVVRLLSQKMTDITFLTQIYKNIGEPYSHIQKLEKVIDPPSLSKRRKKK